MIPYVKATDKETTAFERRPHRSQEEGACHTVQGHMGKHQGGSEGSKTQRGVWPQAFLCEAGQANLRSLGFSSLNNFSRLWAVGVPLVVGTWPWSDFRQGVPGLVCEC